jgi:fibronectin type 3 domain-containing protein
MVQKGGFKPINKDAVLQEYFEDADTSIDGTYHYRVSALTSQYIESDPSNTVSVDVSDIYPPDPPANLVSFRAEDSIFLTWNEVQDRDFSHYRLYRRLKTEEEFAMLADGLKQNFSKDESVQRGIVYIYTVTAVDKKGNESGASNEVSESID